MFMKEVYKFTANYCNKSTAVPEDVMAST